MVHGAARGRRMIATGSTLTAVATQETAFRDVLHHPADHPYVAHLGVTGIAVDGGPWDVERLVDAGVRIVHLHFGFEHLPPESLHTWTSDLRRAGIALVHTVHDLDNPHLLDQRPFHRSVATLVTAADALLTLTPTAARSVEQRYGRRAVVVAHPHVVPLAELDRHSPDLALALAVARTGVYVHAGTCRPNLDLALLERIGRVAGPFGGLLIHARETTSRRRLDQVRHVAERVGGRIDIGARLTDEELWDRLRRARVVVLAYRWGTHSGLLEAAHDLGTPVVAPPIGAFADQGAHVVDVDDPAATLARADRPGRVVSVASRLVDVASASAVHRRVYADLRCRARP